MGKVVLGTFSQILIKYDWETFFPKIEKRTHPHN